MKRPDWLTLRADFSLLQRLFGLPFVLGSFLWFGFGATKAEEPTELAMFMLAGLVFLAGGLWIASRRRAIYFDPQRRQVVVVRGVFFGRHVSHDVEIFSSVRIAQESRRGSGDNSSNTYTVYAVRLVRDNGELLLGDRRAREQAFELAEWVAVKLRLPLLDATGAREVSVSVERLLGEEPPSARPAQSESVKAIRPSGSSTFEGNSTIDGSPSPMSEPGADLPVHLDLSAPIEGDGADQYQELHPRMLELTEQGECAEYRVEGDRITVTLPALGWRKNHFGPSMVVLGFFGLPGLLLLFCVPPLGLMLLFLAILGAAFLPFKWKEQWSSQEVVLDPSQLMVKARGAEHQVPWSAVLDMHVSASGPPGPGSFSVIAGGVIVVNAGKVKLLFGDALSREQLQRLFRIIAHYRNDPQGVAHHLQAAGGVR